MSLIVRNSFHNWKKQTSILQGWTANQTIDGTLDYAVVKYLSNSKDCYKPMSFAFLSKGQYNVYQISSLPPIGADYRFYVVMSDTCDTQTRYINTKYLHTLTLVEPTKYIERIIVPKGAYTTGQTLKDQVEKVLINAETLVYTTYGYSQRFELDSATAAALAEYPAEEKYYANNLTLREILDDMFSAINARAFVPKIVSENSIKISHYDTSKVLTPFTLTGLKIVNQNWATDIEGFTHRVVSYGENALSTKRHPIIQGFEPFRPAQLETLTTSNATVMLQMPIEELIKFDLKTVVHFKYVVLGTPVNPGDPTEYEQDIELTMDLTDYFVEEEIYALLKTSEKEKHLFYVKGEKKLSNLTGQSKLWFGIITQAVLEYVLDDYLTNYDFDTNPAGIVYPAPPGSQGFHAELTRKHYGLAMFTNAFVRTEYIPYIDYVFDVSSQENLAVLTKGTAMIDNQSESIVDVVAYGDRLQQKVKMTGDKKEYVDIIASDITELKQPGDYIVGGAGLKKVVSKVSFSVFSNFIKARYEFTNNYANLFQNISFNRKKTLYKIPLESIRSDILIKNVITVSAQYNVSSDFWGLNQTAMLAATRCLTNSNRGASKHVKGFLIEVKEHAGINDDPANDNYYANNYYFMYSNNYVGGNSLYFKMVMLDNFSAALTAGTATLGGKKVISNPYCDANGVLNELELALVSDISAVNTADKYRRLPQVYKTDVIESEKLHNSMIKLKKYKDPAEAVSITYQVEFIPDSANVILGKAFFKNNLLAFKDEVGANMKLYVSNEPYGQHEVFKVKGTVSTQWSFDIVVGNNVVTLVLTGSGYPTHWAIGDADRNLYIASSYSTAINFYTSFKYLR